MTSRADKLARALNEQAAHHKVVASHADCAPEKTINWDHSKQCEQAAAELRRLASIEAAARNLVKVKGRYHTEQAFKALAATLENPHG